MLPIGPYRHSLGMASDRYIVSDYRQGQVVTVIVINGQQRSEGSLCDSVRDAKWHLEREGFVLRK